MHEPEVDPIINDATARFTMAPFLALFTTGAALPIRRGPSSDPEGFHWIDRVMSAVKTLSTFVAILPIPYLVFAARVYAEVQEEQLRLRFEHGLTEGWKQAAQRFSEGSTDVWTDRTERLKLPAWKAGQNPSLRPGPETPGVDATSSLQNLNSMTTQNHQPTPFGGEPEHPLTPATRSAHAGPEGTD